MKFEEESRGREVEVLLLDGSRFEGWNLKADPQFTEWNVKDSMRIIRIPTDSVHTISRDSWSRGMTDGFFLAIPISAAAILGTAGANAGLVFGFLGPYLLLIPPVAAGVGASISHTYKYRFGNPKRQQGNDPQYR